ncbi:hypothetical protein, partial [Nostoc sp. CHAB 5715]|uniref:hypothetical protein n=1 Tax=Nostoc sp. CHAB 5715 TaxID=2780400 RepID=UPI001E3A29C1
ESMRLQVLDTHLRSSFLLSTRRTRVRNDSYSQEQNKNWDAPKYLSLGIGYSSCPLFFTSL